MQWRKSSVGQMTGVEGQYHYACHGFELGPNHVYMGMYFNIALLRFLNLK
jgi:hypothetical protein